MGARVPSLLEGRDRTPRGAPSPSCRDRWRKPGRPGESALSGDGGSASSGRARRRGGSPTAAAAREPASGAGSRGREVAVRLWTEPDTAPAAANRGSGAPTFGGDRPLPSSPPSSRARSAAAAAPSAASRCGKRGQQGTRWIAAWGRPHARPPPHGGQRVGRGSPHRPRKSQVGMRPQTAAVNRCG